MLKQKLLILILIKFIFLTSCKFVVFTYPKTQKIPFLTLDQVTNKVTDINIGTGNASNSRKVFTMSGEESGTIKLIGTNSNNLNCVNLPEFVTPYINNSRNSIELNINSGIDDSGLYQFECSAANTKHTKTYYITLQVGNEGSSYKALWGTRKKVTTIADFENILYFGGRFSTVRPDLGSGIVIDKNTGKVKFAYFPKISGYLAIVISDGGGGWYIGGTFTKIGNEERNNLARVNSDGSLHPWNPNADGKVSSILIDDTKKTLYVGGKFTNFAGEERNRLAAFDLNNNGVLTNWNPNSGDEVLTMVIDKTTRKLYAGGKFTTVNEEVRNRLAAFDLDSNGILTDWNPGASTSVSTMTIDEARRSLYIGGGFTTIGEEVRNRLAAFDLDNNGTLTDWNPGASGNVSALTIDETGGTLYIGGSFTTIGEEGRNRLAAFNLDNNGTLTDWNPGASGNVSALTIDETGGTLYIGGSFTTIGEEGRNRLAAFDLSNNGLLTDWNPTSLSQIYTLAIDGINNVLYVGGCLNFVGAARGRLAAFDLNTGSLTDWNPNTNGQVHTLAINKTTKTLYVGGRFTSIDGIERNRLASFDLNDNGALTDWNPNLNNDVYSLVIDETRELLYAGGRFTTISGSTRNRLAAFDLNNNGSLTPWSPNINGNLKTIALDESENILYMGGCKNITLINGQARKGLASFDLNTGSLNSWNPNPNDTILTLTIDKTRNILYTGGNFTMIGAQTRNKIAAFDMNDNGSLISWEAIIAGLSSRILTLLIDETRDTLYVGGRFTSINEQERNNIAAFDLTNNGSLTPWISNLNREVRVMTLSETKPILYIGGNFNFINGKPNYHLSAVSIFTGEPIY